MRIDWRRCAEPQEDQHDTEVTWHFVTTTTTPMRRQLHRRRLVAGAPSIFDGTVAVRYIAEVPPGHPRNQHGPLQHPNIDAAVEYVRRWPTVFKQFQRLMDTFHPMLDANIPIGGGLGSNSHSDEDKFGTMYATVFDPTGLAEAFAHEMAHNKLRGLGVHVESAQRIVTNPPTELFESPIRKDRLRPMTAVLHAQYSFIYVTALDLEMLKAETSDDAINNILSLLSNNVPRMEMGFEQLRSSLKVDLIGEQFMEGFFAWSERVLRAGNEALQKYGVAKAPLEKLATA